MDLSKTIEPKSDQLNADDLIEKSKTITITKITGSNNEQQPVNIHFEGDNGKPFKPCKTMRRLLVQIWGGQGENYIGRSITLFRDDNVKWADVKVGGIRISHLSHIDKPTDAIITVKRGKRRPVTIQPLKSDKKEFQEGGFEKALEAVKTGKIEAQKIINTYKLTNEQLKTIQND